MEKLNRDIKKIVEFSPLVHNITNFVVMNNTANALLALGASPVMAHAKEEMVDMTNIASALVINIGTLSDEMVYSVLLAGANARKLAKPIVFDPVGAGASKFRSDVSWRIIKSVHPNIIRGNASEIISLINTCPNISEGGNFELAQAQQTKGVDSTTDSQNAVDAAKKLAKITGSVVVISGKVDYITDGEKLKKVDNGSAMMPRVTGMGCTSTALMGAFAAVNNDYLEAAYHTMLLMGLVGEKTAEISNGPGSFQVNFLDMLYEAAEYGL